MASRDGRGGDAILRCMSDTPNSDRAVRTRFAPSPTGFMHIGGMRTALFTWLFARANDGQFILRIDDTDASRNDDAALQPILDAFAWMGLDWDEGPVVGGPKNAYFQSQRRELYDNRLRQLIESGAAYHDFETPEEVAAQRKAAEKSKTNYISSRVSIGLSADELKAKLDAGDRHVIRLLIPRGTTVTISDAVRGDVSWSTDEMPDPVLARGDGSPLYNFASVCDDVAMEISHVIRAEEHLSNAAIQALLFDALGAERPVFAHIPFVAAPGGSKKLSKREKDLAKYRTSPGFKKLFDIGDHVLPLIGVEPGPTMNPVMVAFYREVGFLPDAVFNALARLGWSQDDSTEIMSREFVVQNFSLDRVVKASAGLDPDKLLSFQEHWVGELDDELKLDRCCEYLDRAGWPYEREFVRRLLNVLGERIKLLSDILNYDEYFVVDETMTFDEKAFKKRIGKPEGAKSLLASFWMSVSAANAEGSAAHDFHAASLEAAMKTFCEANDIGLGQIIHAVRVAVTGKPAGPGLFEAMELLGRDRCGRRIDRALAKS